MGREKQRGRLKKGRSNTEGQELSKRRSSRRTTKTVDYNESSLANRYLQGRYKRITGGAGEDTSKQPNNSSIPDNYEKNEQNDDGGEKMLGEMISAATRVAAKSNKGDVRSESPSSERSKSPSSESSDIFNRLLKNRSVSLLHRHFLRHLLK